MKLTRSFHHLVRKAKRLRNTNNPELLYETVRVLFVAKLCKQIFK